MGTICSKGQEDQYSAGSRVKRLSSSHIVEQIGGIRNSTVDQQVKVKKQPFIREQGKSYTIEEELKLQASEKAAGKSGLMMGMGGSMDQDIQEQKSKMWDEGLAEISANVRYSFGDMAFGCLLGAFAADSCGSYLEFNEETADQQELLMAMMMPGGGPHSVASGQITDDSEMAMSLLSGIVEDNDKDDIAPNADKKIFDFETIGVKYYLWYDSDPFDIGETTQRSIQNLSVGAQSCFQCVRKYNHGKSNGSLMRCTPMAIWCAKFEEQKNYQALYTAASADVRFVHCNDLVIDSVFLYELAIGHLLNNPTGENKCKDAFDLAFKMSQDPLANHRDVDYGDSCKLWLETAQEYFTKSLEQDDPKQPWLNNMRTGTNNYNVIHQMGFIKHAFILSFYYLLRAGEKEKLNPKDFSYRASIQEIVSMGGDTDTNACIAGGMIGAIVGGHGLDFKMIKSLLMCDVTKEGQRRPENLSVGRHAIPNLKKLINKRVTQGIKYKNCPDGILDKE